ncbi:Hypothetical predicted protein, partial [Podarcis lilfordi]
TLMNMPSIAPVEKIKHQTGAERAAAPQRESSVKTSALLRNRPHKVEVPLVLPGICRCLVA